MERKIVVFDQRMVNQPAQEALVNRFGGVVIKHLNLINALAVYLPPPAVGGLRRRAEVVRVDDDVVVYALVGPKAVGMKGKPSPPAQPAQVVPWGIARILAPDAWSYSTGRGVRLAIVDTGIDLDHPDLQANIQGGVNTIRPNRNANDDNGHGTHVAGIAGALNNSIGVVGVAPQVSLYAVKVLNSQGSGFLSDVIEGLTWCINQHMQVVNMSLGADVDVQSFHNAVTAVYNAGIVQVAAAGNSGGSVGYPAAYPEVISVSATDGSDNLASWSSRGKVELAAPGVNIYSTYNTGYYATMSGTSMASPHVAGVAALRLAVHPGETPDQVKAVLQTTALDLGTPGYDYYFGAGLVQALGAVQ
jgi:subtilisin family serine protease